jgi:hypothetical protein
MPTVPLRDDTHEAVRKIRRYCRSVARRHSRAAPRRRRAQEKLTVWWVKGFYKSEDDALVRRPIKKFEAEDRRQGRACRSTPVQDMIPKTVAALDAGTPPDVAYADVYDFQVARQVGVRRQARGPFRHPRCR